MKKAIPTLILGTVMTIGAQAAPKDFNYNVERFADIEVLRYEVPGFDNLSLRQKTMVYYLAEAAHMGRDIIWDQHGKHNLQLRQLLEAIYLNYDGDKTSADYLAFETYLKQVWFGNGIHHHYSTEKFVPAFSQDFFVAQVNALPQAQLPLLDGQSKAQMMDVLVPVIFDPTVMAKGVNQDAEDVITSSANNLYEGVTQAEVEAYFAALKDPNDKTPISYGLNSKLVKRDGKIVEEHYHLNGLYGEAIAKIIYWLTKAKDVAENDAQRNYITTLIDYYTTGDLRKFDEYSIAWTQDLDSEVDFVNGFIESYGDPLGMTGAWESYVNFKNVEASHRTQLISDNAQWFEDRSPVDARFRKPVVKGVSAKVITAATIAGDAFPATAIGINLPNANWIRAEHGSKSVTIENITEAYAMASVGNGFNEEFVIDEKTRQHLDKYLYITDMLHTDLHECLGHGSGQLLPGVDPDAMKEHGSTLEETRADLYALYFLADPKLVELGKNIEEAHMRDRQLIAKWILEHGKKSKAVQLIKRKGKTYLKINDYQKVRELVGQLLSEVQRIKSEGDYEACCKLVNDYAVKVDPELHAEILERYSKLNMPPYRGFVNPRFVPTYDEKGNIIDVKVDYTEGYAEQMLRLSRDYSPLTK